MESAQRTSCCSGPHRGPHSETSWKFRPAHGRLPLYLTMLRILHVWLGRRSRLSWIPEKEARLSSRSVTRALVILCSFDSGEINAPGSPREFSQSSGRGDNQRPRVSELYC